VGSISGAEDTASGAKGSQSDKTLSVNDQLVISATSVEGIGDKPYRVDADGTLTLPLVGKVRA
jgi:protein involved in polysaccharide export with SLBB domain